MSIAYQTARDSRRSQTARLLSNEGVTWSLERTQSHVYRGLMLAADIDSPRHVVNAGKQVLDNAVARGETLSPETAKLHRKLNAAVARRKVPVLLRASH